MRTFIKHLLCTKHYASHFSYNVILTQAYKRDITIHRNEANEAPKVK